jgi:energy-coupling factor transporter ATP-binding protein EcfA2
MQGGDDVKIEVHNRCQDFRSYRAARVKSLFNAESGCNFDLTADLPIDDKDWKVGLIVGPSGSGKTSLGRKMFGPAAFYEPADWPSDRPIIDAIAPAGDFDAVTSALASVGLGCVPAWLRPYRVLSNGERFRADLARIISEAPAEIVIDEFTSVVDRQIAKFGAMAFQKAWRRTGGRCVLLSCHYDIIDWLEPDWVFDTAKGHFARGSLWRRPRFELEIWQTDWRHWPLFEPHHYLKLPRMIAARCYVGTVDGEPVCHVAIGTANKGAGVEARGCRLVVLPEWQGAGVGLRFLNAVCQLQMDGGAGARLPGRRVTTMFHTSHPGLAAALRRDPKWLQVSAHLHGASKARSARSISRSGGSIGRGAGYGGHFRAVQGFRYVGEQRR